MAPEPGTRPRRRTARMYIAAHRRKVAALTFGAAATAATVVVIGSAGFGAGAVDAETADTFNTRIIDDTVTYYRSVCAALAPVLDIPDALAQAAEDTIGRADPERREHIAATLDEQRTTIAGALTYLSGIDEPTAIRSLTDRHPISYEGATSDLTDAVRALTPTLEQSSDRLHTNDSDTDSGDSSIDETADALRGGLDTVTAGIRTTLDRAKITTESTAAAVRAIPTCTRVFGDPDLPAQDVEIEAAAAFHTTLRQIRTSLAEQGHLLGEFTGHWARDKTAEQIRTELVAAYRHYADAMTTGADQIFAWTPPPSGPADIAATATYPDARDELAHTLREQAHLITADTDLLAATAEPELAPTIETTQRTVHAAAIATTKATARTARLAPIPTTATQNLLDPDDLFADD